jgi:hypothetical protein
MKKIIVCAILFVLVVAILCSCNMQIMDITYNFDYAYVALPNGTVVEGEVDSWMDYESDAIQVVIKGKTYVTHYSNVVLVKS